MASKLGKIAFEPGCGVLGAVTVRIRIERRLVMAIGEFFQTCRHAVSEDRHGRLYQGQLFPDPFDSFFHRIKAGTGSSKRGVGAHGEVAHDEPGLWELCAHPQFEPAVLSFKERVAHKQNPVAILDFKRVGRESGLY